MGCQSRQASGTCCDRTTPDPQTDAPRGLGPTRSGRIGWPERETATIERRKRARHSAGRVVDLYESYFSAMAGIHRDPWWRSGLPRGRDGPPPRPGARERRRSIAKRSTPTIAVDADACPVKREIYRVADRYDLDVLLVAASWIRVPDTDRVRLILVDHEDRLDAADDRIVEEIHADDVVITEDVHLAARCLDQGARVLSPRGRVFSRESIGDAVATRDLMAELREAGLVTGGPKPFAKADRSTFLQRLDEIVQEVLRRGASQR